MIKKKAAVAISNFNTTAANTRKTHQFMTEKMKTGATTWFNKI